LKILKNLVLLESRVGIGQREYETLLLPIQSEKRLLISFYIIYS